MVSASAPTQRPLGVTVLSVGLGLLSVAGLGNSVVWNMSAPHLAASQRGLSVGGPLFTTRTFMYGVSALAACVGLWRMARWARPAYLTWCCCFVAHAMKLRYQFGFAAVLLSAVLLCSGCGKSGTPTQSKTEWIDPNQLQPGPIQHASLTEEQMNRVKRLQKTFSEADPSPLEKWVEDFKRDVNPDNELKIWEAMATAYETFTASRNLTLDAKKEVFQVVLLRSGEPEEQVLQHLKLTALTQKDAREIMALFVEKPTPIEAIKQ